MKNEASFQRLAAITSLLATLLACASIGLQAVVLGVTTDPFAHPIAWEQVGSSVCSPQLSISPPPTISIDGLSRDLQVV